MCKHINMENLAMSILYSAQKNASLFIQWFSNSLSTLGVLGDDLLPPKGRCCCLQISSGKKKKKVLGKLAIFLCSGGERVPFISIFLSVFALRQCKSSNSRVAPAIC